LSKSRSDGQAKVSLAAQKLADIESVFAALAHEQRRHILLTLKFRGGEMTAGAIADRFACSWPTTTRHLQVLEKTGMLKVEKRGRERVYRLDTGRLLSIAGEWLAWFRDRPRGDPHECDREGGDADVLSAGRGPAGETAVAPRRARRTAAKSGRGARRTRTRP
jgi:DNA-binding transcriptional ArsR family regulator